MLSFVAAQPFLIFFLKGLLVVWLKPGYQKADHPKPELSLSFLSLSSEERKQ